MLRRIAKKQMVVLAMLKSVAISRSSLENVTGMLFLTKDRELKGSKSNLKYKIYR